MALAGFGFGPEPVRAEFHSGGVGSCGGCHLAHPDGSLAPPEGSTVPLLRIRNPTDLCLRCHAREAGNSWGNQLLVPGPLFGGGPFVFLTEDNLNDGADGTTNFIPGHAAGHSVVSEAYGLQPDPAHPVAPGGSYPSNKLHCVSCHDPHGTSGTFRLLYGLNSPESDSDGYRFKFSTDPPAAMGVALDGDAESRSNHSAYREGISAWCGNCHGRYHQSGGGSGSFSHPSDRTLNTPMTERYNAYRGTGFLDGDGTEAYVPEVPVEHPDMTTSFRGPILRSSRITCLTCHRAHASSAPAALRWDPNIATWADEGRRSGSYPIPNPFSMTSGDAQLGLCDKCHESSTATAAPDALRSPLLDPARDRRLSTPRRR